MTTKFACTNGIHSQYSLYSFGKQDNQPKCSLSGGTVQRRLLSSKDTKNSDGNKSNEETTGYKTSSEDVKNNVKVVKRVIRRKSRKESRGKLQIYLYNKVMLSKYF